MISKIPKIESYIGFAARAQKIIFGVDSITKRGKRHRVIILCSTAGENTSKQIMTYCEKTNSPLIVLKNQTLEGILKKQNCKVIAVTDLELANAILKNENA